MANPYRQTVYNFHLDGYGHVNNARYLEFLEAARWHFFRQHDLSAVLRQARLVLSGINIRYRRAAALDEELCIDSRLEAVQSRQIRMSQRVYSADGTVYAEAEVLLMPTDEHGRICRLPTDIAADLAVLCAADAASLKTLAFGSPAATTD